MKYYKMLVVPRFVAEDLEKMCQEASSSTKDGVEFDEEVLFVDGRRVSIQVIGCGDREPAWTQGVLFSETGEELSVTCSGDSFLGEYELIAPCGNDEYVVDVVSTADLEENPIWPSWYNDPVQFCRLLWELVSTADLPYETILSLAEEMDLPEYRVREILSRAQGRWDVIKGRVSSGITKGLRSSEVLGRAAEQAGWSASASAAAICDFVDACGLTDQLDGYLSARAGLDRAIEREGQSCG